MIDLLFFCVQAVDLRWGSRVEDDVFQPMFLRELQRCQKVSMGPNILVRRILWFFQNLTRKMVIDIKGHIHENGFVFTVPVHAV